MSTISVVINTLNEEKNLSTALSSVKNFADEVVVVDMESTDKTTKIAKKYGAKVYKHKQVGYVEPARNFAIGKATGDWILILDADETVTNNLKKKLLEVKDDKYTFFRLPRKNIIFGKWIQHTNWWPDYNIRFFKKDSVTWNETIHSVPFTQGLGFDLPAKEEFALFHNHYKDLDEYLTRMLRYTKIQSLDLHKNGYKFKWIDIINKPFGEFLSRFMAAQGYKDGIHGLSLSLLQATSELVLYLRIWELQRYKEANLNTQEFTKVINEKGKELNYWIKNSQIQKTNIFKKAARLFK